MTKYNKLVRDNIPDMIDLDGKLCETHVVKGTELYDMLKMKLDEEIAEFKKENSLEELADIMEVTYALAKVLGYTEDNLVTARKAKRREKGGFDAGIVLDSVDE
jgi:predicted house-cleaning noncanonical NTP pyrophosphatase (MazG superfamily)